MKKRSTYTGGTVAFDVYPIDLPSPAKKRFKTARTTQSKRHGANARGQKLMENIESMKKRKK